MAYRAGSASRRDSPRRRERASVFGLPRWEFLESPVIRARPVSHNGDRRLLASAHLQFENLVGNDTGVAGVSVRYLTRDTSLDSEWFSGSEAHMNGKRGYG